MRSESDAPIPFGRVAGQLSDQMLFAQLRDPQTGRLFWSKRPSADGAKQLGLEAALYREMAGRDARAVLPVDFSDEHGWIFDFDAELFAGRAVHSWDIARHFSESDAAEIRAFAATVIHHPDIGTATIAELTDFQTIGTSRGLRFLDFMIRPEHWWML